VKYSKKNGKYTKFQTWPPSTISRLQEKIRSKNLKNIYIFCREPPKALGKEALCREPGLGALGKERRTKFLKIIYILPRARSGGSRQKIFIFFIFFAESHLTWLSAKNAGRNF
jgi:hypothetical protein